MRNSESTSGNDHRSQFWLTALFERILDRSDSPFFVSVVVFGGPPAVIAALYVGLRWSYMTIPFVFSLAALLVVTSAAPYLIWYYDAGLFPQFRENVRPLLDDPAVMGDIGRRYHGLLARWWWLPALSASVPIPLLLWFGTPFLREHGLFGVADPLFWAVAALLLWIAVIVGIGFLLVAITFLVIREVAAQPLEIDPMHPDGLGGMSAIGHYAIRTTTIFSLGALVLPLQLQYAAAVGPTATILIYVMGGVYGLFIAGSFLYPTIKINRKAEAIRSEILNELREQYYAFKRATDEPTVGIDVETTDHAAEQKLNRLQEEYREYRNVRLYPLQLPVLLRLFTSVLFPLLLLGVEYTIQSI